MSSMSTELSTTQEAFCVEYTATGDAVASYRKAFDIQSIPDAKAAEYANQLLSDPTIKQKIIRLNDSLSPRDVLSKQRVLEELSQLARTSLFPADRLRALDLLGKYYKLFSEKENIQKQYIGDNKIQIIYMSPDHKRLTSISPLRKTARAAITEAIAAEEPQDLISPISASATPAKIRKMGTLEADLESLCG